MKLKKMTNEERLELKAMFHETDAKAERANRCKLEFDTADAAFKAKAEEMRQKYNVETGSSVDLGTGEFTPPLALAPPPTAEVAAAVATGAKRLGRPRKQRPDDTSAADTAPPVLTSVPDQPSPTPVPEELLAGGKKS